MKTIKRFTLFVALMTLVAWGCSSLDPLSPDSVNTGSTSFARFHVMGDNYVAGMQNGGLVEGFQKASWGAVVAQATGPSTHHTIPSISENGIPPTMYVSDFSGPVIDTLETLGQPTNLTYPWFYNNMGIPAATLSQLLRKRPEPGTDTNPFFGIVLRDSTVFGGAATAVEQTIAAAPSFLGVWAGWMDIYGSAAFGGTDAAMTPAASFAADYQLMLDAFDGAADAVVAANIPDILDIPFFTTIPPVVVDPVTREPILIGGNPVPLIGPSGPLSMGDKVTLPASSLLAQGIGIDTLLGGTGLPLPGQVVIEVAELTAIQTRIGEFNTIIDTVCTNRSMPVVDAHALFTRMRTDGFDMRGETYTSAFLQSSLFGVDGLHPNSIGYYVIALEFIRVINANFGAAIPQPLAPLGPFRSPSLGSSSATAAAATISQEEWAGLRRLMESGIADRLQ
jgi:hypothetical protein